MPKTIDAAAKTKAELAANNPIYLIELGVTGTPRFAVTNAQIVFPSSGGHTYNGWGITFGAIKASINGDVERVSVRFDNTNLTMSGLVNSLSFPGKTLTIKKVFGNLLGSSAYAMTVFVGLMGAPVVNERFVEVMAVSPMARLNKQAGRLYQNLCPWEYKGTECGDGGTSCNKTISGCIGNANIQRFGGFVYIPNRIL
jgi:phage-related protein